MKELLYAIVEELVEDKSAIKITEDEPNEEGVIVLHLSVARTIWEELSASRAESLRRYALLCVPALPKAV